MSRRGRSVYRLLSCFKEAGVDYDHCYRARVAGFLQDGFEHDEQRRGWLRKVIFAVKSRHVENPGAYVKWLAENHVHHVLGSDELGRYLDAKSQGFGREGCWDVELHARGKGGQEGSRG